MSCYCKVTTEEMSECQVKDAIMTEVPKNPLTQDLRRNQGRKHFSRRTAQKRQMPGVGHIPGPGQVGSWETSQDLENQTEYLCTKRERSKVERNQVLFTWIPQ